MQEAVTNWQANWQANWIWTSGDASPRNAWHCFRRTFDIPADGWNAARLAITADSRYLLYLNGERLGRGPVRSWPFRQSFDRYELGHLLKRGQPNCLAVMVMHFGVSTFCYLRGRGGLLAQLDIDLDGERVKTITTDSGWRTSPHLGHEPRAPRMSVQLSFAERVDARLWDDSWIETGFEDDSWVSAVEIGPAGMKPWVELEPSPIPPLTEEVLWPERVESLNAVTPISWTGVIDTCAQMIPESAGHANAVMYVGCLATVIRVEERMPATLGSPLATISPLGACFLNGRRLEPGSGVDPERYLQLELETGDNLLLIDVSGHDRGGVGLHLGIDCEGTFELVSPLGPGAADSPFVTVGPFEKAVVIDHQPMPELSGDHPAFHRALESSSAEALLELREWLRPVPLTLVSPEDVFTTCVWTRARTVHSIPESLEPIATASPGPATVPSFKGEDSELILDLGQESSGYLSFDIEAAEGTILDLYGFEYLHEGWRQDTHGLDNTLRYICHEGRQQYHSAVRRGLRYLMIVIRKSSQPVRIHRVQMVQSTYPVTRVGTFECSDELLNDIWEISRRTTQLCMEDTFVDCPAYEQTFWVGDSRNESLIASYLFGAEELTERCLRLVPPSRVHTPFYNDQVPSGWNSVIPNWTFFWVIACHEHYRRTGDAVFAEEIWSDVRFTLDHYLDSVNERGLLDFEGWNFLDWADIDQPRRGVVSHQAMFMVRALREAACLAQVANDEAGRERFRQAAQDQADAINQYLWSTEHGAYVDCLHPLGQPSSVLSMQTQVVAYLCDVPRPERKERLEKYLIDPPGHFVQIGSPFMSFFYYEALAKLGRFDMLVEDIRRNYGAMLEHGATTCWEMYPNSDQNRSNPNLLTRSHCHAWSAAPGYMLGAHVLGVSGVTPGWERVKVMPQPSGLEWASGSVPLPGTGSVDVAWKLLDEKTLELKAWLPEGVEADVALPDGYRGTVEVMRN